MKTLQKTFGEEKRWVNYKMIKKDGRITKIPYSPVTKRLASSIELKDWATYEQAIAVSDQIGIVFTPDQLLLGIDLDHCLNGTKIISETVLNFIIDADTYTEISPSGTGLHLFLKLSAPLKLIANRHEGYECYTSGRYFTVTNNPYKEEKEVRIVTPEEAVDLLMYLGYPWKKEEEKPISVEKTHTSLPSDVIIKKMLAKTKVKKLYNGDTSDYKNDESVADLALLAHLAFWTGKDALLMESLWLASPLGAREKTQKRKDYRDRSIKTAIAGCKDVYTSQAKKIQDANPDILFLTIRVRGDEIIVQNTENICRVLRGHTSFQNHFRYDTFCNTLEIKENDIWRILEDNDAVNIQTHISILFPCFAKVGKDMVYDSIIKVSKENTIDSAIDYIRSIKWDGVARLDSWLTQTYGVPDDIYHRAVGSNWLKGLVKRLVVPGCKFDYVLVLEGEQGIKKSTSLGVLGSSWHVETTMSTDTKDFFMQFQGKAIIEFSEGETLSRTEVKRMKAIITMQSDKYRPAYGRLSVDFPRRCVFAMTTNQTEYLKDETGNRRWLPVACQKVADIEWLTTNRDQLYAEAYERVINKNETTWEFPEEETLFMQSQRREHNPNQDLVFDWYYNKLTESEREKGITTHQVYRDAICGGFVNKPLDRYNEMQVADILKTVLKLKVKRKMVNGIQANRWFGKDEVEEVVELSATQIYDKF